MIYKENLKRRKKSSTDNQLNRGRLRTQNKTKRYSIYKETINEQELSINDHLKSQNNDMRFQKLPFNLDQGK